MQRRHYKEVLLRGTQQALRGLLRTGRRTGAGPEAPLLLFVQVIIPRISHAQAVHLCASRFSRAGRDSSLTVTTHPFTAQRHLRTETLLVVPMTSPDTVTVFIPITGTVLPTPDHPPGFYAWWVVTSTRFPPNHSADALLSGVCILTLWFLWRGGDENCPVVVGRGPSSFGT